jgi:SusD family.
MKTNIYIALAGFLMLVSCRKSSLERKPDQQLVVPSTLNDFEALLNNTTTVFGVNYLTSAEISAADYDITDDDYNALSSARTRNLYAWKPDIYEGSQNVPEWDKPYQQVFYCNIVLDGLSAIDVNSQIKAAFDNVKGKALFNRGYAFYNLLQVFAPGYTSEAKNMPGIPLRVTADINVKTTRASLEASYMQAIADLKVSLDLLPEKQPYLTQPSKAAAAALLAKMYLTIGNYQAAEEFADRALAMSPVLLDLNHINVVAAFPFDLMNNETLFFRGIPADATFNAPMCKIRSSLYEQYQEGDLRKQAFFQKNPDQTVSFKGNYTGSRGLFTGLAWDEVYLIKAEAAARNKDSEAAMRALNTLLKTRWETGKFTEYQIDDPDEALMIILKERRKELLMRGIRWSDLKRLNAHGGQQIILERTINGRLQRLMPGDPKYNMPIPDQVIALTGISQNER